jgi:phosphatidylglycerophosphatase A
LNKGKKSAIFGKNKGFKESDTLGKAAVILATWFGMGYFPFAPGTIGTVGAIPLSLALLRCPFSFRVSFFLGFFVLAVWASGRSESLLGTRDPSQVVIDEVVGFLTATIFMQTSWRDVGIAFFLFRFFDIVKPFPAGLLDRKLGGGIGIVLDDVAAGGYALGVIFLMHLLLG